MEYRKLGDSDLHISALGLGTMTFGEQNSEAEAHEQLDYAVSRGVNFIDTAEMYPVAPRAETVHRTESYIGNWLKHQQRDKLVVATKIAGPARGFTWIRNTPRIDRALKIIDNNLALAPRHRHDLEVHRTCAELIRHDIRLIRTLGEVETILDRTCGGNQVHFQNNRQALANLRQVESMIEAHIAERRRIYADLVAVWEKTRLPKGLSLPSKAFFHARDRARHFANRTASMQFLVIDEERLDLEGYLERLRRCIADYEAAHLKG